MPASRATLEYGHPVTIRHDGHHDADYTAVDNGDGTFTTAIAVWDREQTSSSKMTYTESPGPAVGIIDEEWIWTTTETSPGGGSDQITTVEEDRHIVEEATGSEYDENYNVTAVTTVTTDEVQYQYTDTWTLDNGNAGVNSPSVGAFPSYAINDVSNGSEINPGDAPTPHGLSVWRAASSNHGLD